MRLLYVIDTGGWHVLISWKLWKTDTGYDIIWHSRGVSRSLCRWHPVWLLYYAERSFGILLLYPRMLRVFVWTQYLKFINTHKWAFRAQLWICDWVIARAQHALDSLARQMIRYPDDLHRPECYTLSKT